MSNFLARQGLSLFLPLLLGPLVFLLVQALKRSSDWIDSLSPTIKQVAVMLISTAITALAGATGVSLSCLSTVAGCTIGDLNSDALTAILTAGAALALHFVQSKGKQA